MTSQRHDTRDVITGRTDVDALLVEVLTSGSALHHLLALAHLAQADRTRLHSCDRLLCKIPETTHRQHYTTGKKLTRLTLSLTQLQQRPAAEKPT